MSSSLSFPSLSLPSFLSPTAWKEKRIRNEREVLMQRMADEILTELGITLSFTIISSLFVTSLAGLSVLFITAISLVALNTFFRYITFFFLPLLSDASKKKECQILYRHLAIPFAIFDLTTRGALVHELGHYLAISLLFQNANPSISLFPFQGGSTSFDDASTLSSLGKLLGEKRVLVLIAAAGPLFALLFASVALILAHYLQNSHEQLSQYLHSISILNILNHIIYALSALSLTAPEMNHDFFFLWALGNIHPLISALFLFLVPLLIKGILIYADTHPLSPARVKQLSEAEKSRFSFFPRFFS